MASISHLFCQLLFFIAYFLFPYDACSRCWKPNPLEATNKVKLVRCWRGAFCHGMHLLFLPVLGESIAEKQIETCSRPAGFVRSSLLGYFVPTFSPQALKTSSSSLLARIDLP
jgi:hypothetical protein